MSRINSCAAERKYASSRKGKLRILVVDPGIVPVGSNCWGGVERHTFSLAKELAKIGHEVHFLTRIPKANCLPRGVIPHLMKGNIDILSYPFPKQVILSLLHQLKTFFSAKSVLMHQEFNVIHIHDVRGNLTGLLLGILEPSTAKVFTVHGPNPWMVHYQSPFEDALRRVVYTLLDSQMIRKADQVITVSPSLMHELMWRFGIPRDKICFVPNGVNYKLFRPKIPLSAEIRNRYGLDREYLLYVGRLSKRKATEMLLRAFQRIGDKKLMCLLVGDGPERYGLELLSRQLSLEQNVVFTGSIPDDELVALYSNAEFFVLPSVAEGLPLVVMEAMSSGLPVIASELPGMASLVHHGETGFLFPTGRIDLMSKYMKRLKENDKLRSAMRKQARQFIRERFSWTMVARKTVEVYRKAIQSREIHR